MTRFIFITGGVASSLGKGLAAASLAALLQARGYKTRLRKLDPYLNIDPGTMSPIQHGEVFVTEDGAETDLDLGHYERFTGVDARKGDNVTAGKIYSTLLAKERKGDYLGGTVQVIPHVTDLIKNFVLKDTDGADFILCEIGGTIGDIEGLPFYEAIRQIGYQLGSDKTMYIHLTLLPYIPSAKELKTKPTQHSVKELRSIGIQPNMILCRSDRVIPQDLLKKIALFCNVPEADVIPALDAKNIYEVPVSYHEYGLDTRVANYFKLSNKKPDLKNWNNIIKTIRSLKGEVTVAIVGKYNLADAYKSLLEALDHGGFVNNAKVKVKWLDAEFATGKDYKDVDAIVVPGGFGERGTKGKIDAIRYAREKKIPFLGICFGMQMAVIETARNVAKIKDANTTEFGPCASPVVGLMTEWKKGAKKEKRGDKGDIGGTMRLGAYPCELKKGSKAHEIYGAAKISERHRHRYEANINYAAQLEKAGLIISGISPDGKLPEIVERKDHPWFVAVQFHPELKSRPFQPHPLFVSFVKAAMGKGKVAKPKRVA